jgi:hypothetical protein
MLSFAKNTVTTIAGVAVATYLQGCNVYENTAGQTYVCNEIAPLNLNCPTVGAEAQATQQTHSGPLRRILNPLGQLLPLKCCGSWRCGVCPY